MLCDIDKAQEWAEKAGYFDGMMKVLKSDSIQDMIENGLTAEQLRDLLLATVGE